MDKDKINEIIKGIRNPISGATLNDENRIQEVKLEGDSVEIVYKRDGIDPQGKRKIEDAIYESLAGQVEEDNILVKTISSNKGEDVMKGSGKAPQAETTKNQDQEAGLKVGHAQPAPKKQVQNVKHVIGVSSGKGGVGKSTVAVNLAYALKNSGKKVGLLDADIYGPSLPMLLNKRGAKPRATEDKKILPLDAEGLKFISFGLFIEEKDPVIWRGPMLGGVLNQFLFDVEWGELDYLIVDLPPGTGDVQLSLSQATDVDGMIVVSTPQDVALLDSTKGLKMFEKMGVKTLGMIENMSYFVPDDNLDKKYFIFGEGGVEKAAKELDVPFLGQIPIEIALREGSDKGEPYMNDTQYEGRPVWNAYMDICKKIDSILSGDDKNKKPGIFQRFFK